MQSQAEMTQIFTLQERVFNCNNLLSLCEELFMVIRGKHYSVLLRIDRVIVESKVNFYGPPCRATVECNCIIRSYSIW